MRCVCVCDGMMLFQKQQIAANRMFIVQHKAYVAKWKRTYPMAASLPYHQAMQNVTFVESKMKQTMMRHTSHARSISVC